MIPCLFLWSSWVFLSFFVFNGYFCFYPSILLLTAPPFFQYWELRDYLTCFHLFHKYHLTLSICVTEFIFLFIWKFSLVFHLKFFSFLQHPFSFSTVFISICHVITRWIRLVATTTWWLSGPSCLTIGSSEASTCPRSSTASALTERAGDSWSKWAFVVWNVPDILVYT